MLLALAYASAGCSRVGGAANDTGRHAWTAPGHLRIASLGDPNALNPLLANSQIDVDISMFWAGYLFNWSDHDTLVPELATTVPTVAGGGISRDERTITYTLRRGVKWHDGAAFTADDVIFTWHAIMNPKTSVGSRVGYDLIASIDRVDEYTVRVHLKRPWAPFVNTFLTMSGTPYAVLPKHVLARYPDLNRVPYNDRPLGTGPFKIVEWKRGTGVRFAANPAYWRGPPKLARVDFLSIPSDNTLITQLKTHEIDMYYNAPTAIYAQLQDIPGTHLYLTPFTQYNQVGFNTSRPALRDRRVRQALVYAIDRGRLIRDVGHSVPIPGDTDQPPFFWAHNARVHQYPYDPARARVLLEAAGWKPGPDGIRMKAGARLQLEIATVTGSATGGAIAVLVQSQWRDIGVDLVIKTYPASLFLGNYGEGGIVQTGKFDVALQSWVGGIDPDDSTVFMCDQIPPGGQNVYRYCNPRLDGAEKDALGHADRAARKTAYDAIQAMLAEDVPMIVLWYARRIEVVNTDLKNYKPAHAVTMFWNTYEYAL